MSDMTLDRNDAPLPDEGTPVEWQGRWWAQDLLNGMFYPLNDPDHEPVDWTDMVGARIAVPAGLPFHGVHHPLCPVAEAGGSCCPWIPDGCDCQCMCEFIARVEARLLPAEA